MISITIFSFIFYLSFISVIVEGTVCKRNFISDHDSSVWQSEVIEQIEEEYENCVDGVKEWANAPTNQCEIDICAFDCISHYVIDGVSL